MTKRAQRRRGTKRPGPVAFRSFPSRARRGTKTPRLTADPADTALQEALDALRPRHRDFVLALAGQANWNGAEAYRLIRGPGGGAEANARIRAAEIRARPDVKAAERAIQSVLLRDWQPGDVLDRLSRAAGGDITDVFRNGVYDEDRARELRIVKKVKFRTRTCKGGTYSETEVEIHDPIAAVMQIARIKGLV